MNFVTESEDLIVVEIDNNNSISVIIDNKSLSLTSKYNKEKEEEIFLKQFNKKSIHQIYLVLGIGTGEWLTSNVVSDVTKENKIIVIEPSITVFNYFKKNFIEIENNNIFIYSGDDMEKVESYLLLFNSNMYNINIVGYGNYINIYLKEYKELLKQIKLFIVEQYTSQFTIKLLSRDFTRNIIRNSFGGVEYSRIDDYKNVHNDIPALILSAGPSLEKQLYKIKNFNGIILTGGRTLGLLLDLGITPTYLVSIDPQKNAYYLVEDHLNIDVPLITAIESSSDIVMEYDGPKVLMNSQSISDKPEYLGEKLDLLNLGKSVANTSFSIAEYMGCNPIVFIGQDLAFTSGKHHAESTLNEKFDNDNHIKSSFVEIEVPGYYGGFVESKNTFVSFLRWFEEFIALSDKEVINCTEGGASIEGAKQMSFDEYLQSDKNINNLVRSVSTDTFKFDENIVEEIYKLIKAIVITLKKSKKNAKELHEKVKNPMTKVREINQLLKKLDSSDDEIKELGDHNTLLSYLVVEAYNDFTNTVRNKKQTTDTIKLQIAESNEIFYNELYNSFMFFQEELKDIIGDYDV